VLDARRLRNEPDAVVAGLARRGVPEDEVRALAALDADVRAAVSARDGARAEVKRLSKEVGQARKAGDTVAAEELQARSRATGDIEREADETAVRLEEQLRDALLRVPNIPAADCPDGAGAEDNVVLRSWTPDGQPFDEGAYAPHQLVPHWDVAKELGLLDLERGAKLSGAMFPLWTGQGARLLRGLTQWALDGHVQAGWLEVRPPTLVRTATIAATGQLPKFAEDMYRLERDDLWLIPTAEAPLTSMARDELLDPGDLPLRFTAYTPCFRREAGSAGRDTRGLLRSHEFDKVELMSVCTAEQADGVFSDILGAAEALLRGLELPYRVLDLCAGDLGFSSMRTFDLEVWAPGVGAWLEVSSVSWFGDFQARRAGTRHRVEGGGTALCHTLNGSALAWPRVVAAVLETHRDEDGRVRIPDAVRPWVGGLTHLG
jgi:seryl-tRNA synthetase